MRFLTFLFSVLILAANAQEKVGVTSVITTDADRNYGIGHSGSNAEYIQQLRNAVLLPVSLMSFDLKASNNSILIEWKTASEKNSSHFTLKRAGDDKIFADLKQIQAQKESSSVTYYQYIDRSPLYGPNYYQLEQVDTDGTKTLSKIIATIYNLKERTITSYFSEQGLLNVIINTPEQVNPIKVTVSNISGQVITSKNIKLSESNHYVFNDVFLTNGLYILSFGFEDRIITQKIVK